VREKYFFIKVSKNRPPPPPSHPNQRGAHPNPKEEPTPTLPKGGSAMRTDKEQGVHSFNRMHIHLIGGLIGVCIFIDANDNPRSPVT
jgi:hypothetical protein